MLSVRPAGRVKHSESGMIRVAMTYRLCSPPGFETVSWRHRGRSRNGSLANQMSGLHGFLQLGFLLGR
jgi:hypothetical protein